MPQFHEFTKEPLGAELVREAKNSRRGSFFWVGSALLIFTILNLWIVSEDIWDGLIFNYGIQIGDLDGWNQILDDSGWDVSLPLFNFYLVVAELTNTSYFVVYKVVASAALILTAHEVRQFTLKALRLPSPWPDIALTLAMSGWVWTAASGSAMTPHILFPALAFFAVRLIMSSNSYSLVCLGFLLLLLAYNLSSTILVSFALALAYLPSLTRPFQLAQAKDFWKPIAILILGVAFYFLSSALNPKDGHYIGYNDVIFSLGQELNNVVVSLLWFLFFTAVGLSPLIFLLAVSSQKLTQVQKSLSGIIRNQKILRPLGLVVASSIPYIAVGKSPSIAVWGFDGRHGFLFVMSMAVLLTAMLAHATLNKSWFIQRVSSIGVLLLAFTSFLGQSLGAQFKIERIEFDNQLVEKFAEVLPLVPEGYIYINSSGGPTLDHHLGPGYRTDMQYLFFEATGRADWLTTGDVKAFLSPPDWTSHLDRLMFIYSGVKSNCITHIDIYGKGWGTPFSPLRRTLFEGSEPVVQIRVAKIECSS